MNSKRLLPIMGLALLAGAVAAQEPASPDQIVFFEKEVRPLLIERCYKCHSRDAEKVKGGLHLDTRDGWVRGGDSGPALIPGKPEESLLVKAIRYKVDAGMPPKSKLPEAEIRILVEWIRRGAPDPRKGSVPKAKKKQTGLSLEEGRAFWAYKPVRKPMSAPPRLTV